MQKLWKTIPSCLSDALGFEAVMNVTEGGGIIDDLSRYKPLQQGRAGRPNGGSLPGTWNGDAIYARGGRAYGDGHTRGMDVRVLNSDIRNGDIITGTEQKLLQAAREVVDRYQPNFVLFCLAPSSQHPWPTTRWSLCCFNTAPLYEKKGGVTVDHQDFISEIIALLPHGGRRGERHRGDDGCRGAVMHHLYEHGGHTSPGELFRLLDVTKPRVTAILNELEEQGLILRSAAADDRRGIVVSLTEQGRSAIEDRLRLRRKRLELLVEKIGRDDALALIRILRAVNELRETP